MSTYTTSLGLELITPGSQAGLWGNTTNNSLTLIDQAVTGVTPISFASASGSTYTLSDYNGAADEARSAVLNITGTAIGANNVVIPNKQKTYLVRNNTGQSVVFKTATPTATYSVDAGNSILIFCDGNNNVFTGIQSASTGTLSVSGGGTGATTFGSGGFVKSAGGTSALTASATVDIATETTGTLGVARGGTGATSLTSGALLVGNGTGAVAELVGGTSGYVPTWNGSQWVPTAPASAGVTSLSAGTGISLSGATGAVTIYNTGPSVSTSNTWSAVNYFTGGSQPIRVTGGAGQTLSIGGANLGTTYTELALYVNTSTQALSARSTGTYNATGVYGTISDVRKKENIEPSRNYLADINKVNVVKYSLKEEHSPVPTKLGVIAQELEQIFPSLIDTGKDKDGNEEKSVKMSIFIPMLIKSVQELSAKLDAANARIAALEAK